MGRLRVGSVNDAEVDRQMSASTAPIDVVVVDDSEFMRAVISDMLERHGMRVVAEGRDGEEGVNAVIEHAPDVVTMDISMPRMDGLEAVEAIMDRRPTPILMLSSHAGSDAEITFEALDKGAIDFFAKPGGEVSTTLATLEDELIATVRSVANAHVDDRDTGLSRVLASDVDTVSDPILVIASSTGGPSVVERLIGEIPLDAGFRILIVQHMPAAFTARFAERLDRSSAYSVREAGDGERIGPGEAVVARGDHHLEIAGAAKGRLRLKLDNGPPVNNIHPAADVTMQTLADQADGPVVAAVLTGMGEDGAAGATAIEAIGGTVIAQDEATSAVFGMPKRAIETGAVDRIVPENELGQAILEAVAVAEVSP